MHGIVSFLVQWVAISYTLSGVQKQYPAPQQYGGGGGGGYNDPYGYSAVLPPRTPWSLIEDLRAIAEDDIENFLPQVCNILIERNEDNNEFDPNQYRDESMAAVYTEFENVFFDKCASCFPFGIRVCSLLNAAAYKPSESSGILSNILDSGNSRREAAREERLRYLCQKAEMFTASGKNLPAKYSSMRSMYYKDFNFLLDTFARLGDQLKSYPMQERNFHLRNAVVELNKIVHNRILSRGQGKQIQGRGPSDDHNSPLSSGSVGLSAEQVAQGCPEAAGFSIHFPMQHCSDKILRILQFAVSECEVLPSAGKAPYLLTVELLEQSYPCKSEKLYTQGHVVGTIALDYVRGKSIPYLPPKSLLKTNSHKRLLTDTSVDSTNFASSPKDQIDRLTEGVELGEDYSEEIRSGKEDIQQGETNNNHFHDFTQTIRMQGQQIDPNSRGVNVEIMNDDSINESVMNTEDDVVIAENVQLFARQDEVLILEDEEDRGRVAVKGDGKSQDDQVGTEKGEETEELKESSTKTSTASVEKGEDADIVNGEEDRDNEKSLSNDTADRNKNRYHDDGGDGDGGDGDGDDGGGNNHGLGPIHYDMRGGESQNYNYQNYPNAGGSEPGADSRYTQGSSGGNPPQHWGGGLSAHSQGSSNAPLQPTRQQSPPPLPPRHYQQQPPRYQQRQQPPPPTQHIPFFTPRKTWEEKKALVQRSSAFGHLKGWCLKSFIVKVGDDLRKEILAMQLIELFQKIFDKEQLDIQLRPYQIISTGHSSGLVEFVEGASSIDNIKKSCPSPNDPNLASLTNYFKHGLKLGEVYTPMFGAAVQNFIKSLAGYSLTTYLLQVKDRHNANIMIEDTGSMFHIDFGFIFGDSPGFNMNFENAPFKLTKEYVELMGGLESMTFKTFEDLLVNGFMALAKHQEEIVAVVDLFYTGKRKSAAESIRNRLSLRTRAEVQ